MGFIKKRQVLLWYFLILSSLLVHAAGNKKALIIAIGDYPSAGGWSKINSSNDVTIIKDALVLQGFMEKNIAWLVDKEATKDGILKAFEQLSKKINRGDLIYIHFSGHGQQMQDDNGDEIDGLDEALVPYDAAMRYELDAAKGRNHLRDDQLSVILDGIRKKVGVTGDVIVVLDACHSGTATRAIGSSRGTEMIFASNEFNAEKNANIPLKKGFYEVGASMDLSPVVVISGSSASERNFEYTYENTSYGSLSFAIAKAFQQLHKGMTYRSVFGKVQGLMATMVPRQTPQIEGEIDRMVFAGEMVEQKSYFKIKIWHNQERIVIDAGKLSGLYNNSIVELHESGTTDPHFSTAISRGRVVNAQLAESLVLLDEPIEKGLSERCWVFLSEATFENDVVKVSFNAKVPIRLKEDFESAIKNQKTVKLVHQNPDLLIDYSPEGKGTISLIGGDDRILLKDFYDEKLTKKIAAMLLSRIRMKAQADLLRKIETSNSSDQVSIEIIPIELDAAYKEKSRSSVLSKTNRFGQVRFKEGDFFKMKITNNGKRAAYYSLIAITAEDSISILIPEKDINNLPYRAPSDCRIEAGKSEELRSVFQISEPLGKEFFKFIISSRPMNLEHVSSVRGVVDDQATLSFFEVFFANSFDALNRSTGDYRLPPENIQIQTMVFEIER